MNVGLFGFGTALVLLAVVDALWMSLWVNGGAGVLSSRLTTWAWKGWLTLVGPKHRRILSLFGPISVAGTLLLWVLLLWAGWVLIFAAGEHSLLRTSTRAPADWADTVYFVAYSISTMGNGDFTPNGHGWQIATALAALSGLTLVTLGISYLVSVLSAVVMKRALASEVAGLGVSPEEFVQHGWNGRDFHSLDRTLGSLAAALLQVTQQHLAYPVLSSYLASSREQSLPVGIAVLDDALTLLRHGVPPEIRPDPVALHSARSAVQSYLGTLNAGSIDPADDVPAPPSLEPLREAGIPTVPVPDLSAAMEDQRDRRRGLLGLVRHEGWSWPEHDEGAPSDRTM